MPSRASNVHIIHCHPSQLSFTTACTPLSSVSTALYVHLLSACHRKRYALCHAAAAICSNLARFLSHTRYSCTAACMHVPMRVCCTTLQYALHSLLLLYVELTWLHSCAFVWCCACYGVIAVSTALFVTCMLSPCIVQSTLSSHAISHYPGEELQSRTQRKNSDSSMKRLTRAR